MGREGGEGGVESKAAARVGHNTLRLTGVASIVVRCSMNPITVQGNVSPKAGRMPWGSALWLRTADAEVAPRTLNPPTPLTRHTHPTHPTHPFLYTGLEFSNFMVAPQCAQARAQFLTGRDYLKTGTMLINGGWDYLHHNETTIAHVMEGAG